MDKPGEDAAIAEVISRLMNEHPELPAEQIRADVDKERAAFAAAVVRDFVPLLVERRVTELYRRRSVPA